MKAVSPRMRLWLIAGLVAVLFGAVVAWLLILVTGEYPRGLYDFGVGVLRWLLRVQAYMLLMVDEYPPFSLN